MKPLGWLSRGYRRAAHALVSTGLAEYAGGQVAPNATSEEVGKAVSSADRIMGQGLAYPHGLYEEKTLAIVDTMMLDEAVGTFIDMKKSAALSTDWKSEPATSDDGKSQEHADFIYHCLKRLKGTLAEALADILTAIEYGYSATNRPYELITEGPFKGKLGLKCLKTKSPHAIRFDTDDFLNILPNGILFTDSDYNTQSLPLADFVVYTYRKRFGNPYGYGDCLRAYDRWNSKRWIMKLWDIYNERFAMGTLVATWKAEQNPPLQQHQVVQKFGNDIQARSFIKLPDIWNLQLLESSGRGSDIFEKSINHRNMAIARAMFFPDQIGFSDTGTGSYAKAQTHFSVFMWPLDRIRLDICEAIMAEQVIKPLIDLNYGPQESYPDFVFDPLTDEQRVQWLTNVFTGIEKGALTPDLEIENAVRQRLELAEKEEEKEKKAGGSPPPQIVPPAPPGTPIPPEADLDEHAYQMGPARARRALTQYERKVDVDGIADIVNQLHDSFVNTWAEHFRTQRNQLIDYTRKKAIVTTGDMVAAGGMKFGRTLELRKSLERYLTVSTYFGALEAQREIERARKGNFSMSAEDHYAVDLAKLPLDEIDKFFEKKGLVVSAAIRKASAQAKKEAFWITGDLTEGMLYKAKQIVFRGIRRGDQNWVEAELKRLFDGYLQTGQIKEGPLGTVHRIETIARNQFTTAFNGGRKALFESPEVEDFVEAYQWSAVLDEATTDYCAELDKQPLSKEDVNSIGWPPAHHGCRSIVVPITRGEVYTLQKVPAGIERGVGFELCGHHEFMTHICGCS